MTKRTRAIHPFLIAPFPILLLYSRNLHTVAFAETVIPFVIVGLVALAVWSALRAVGLDSPRAALIVSSGLLLAFSFGHGVRLCGKLGMVSSRLTCESLVLAVEALALAGVVALVVKRPDLVRAATGTINASAFALVGLSLAGIASQAWSATTARPPSAVARPTPALVRPDGRLPDVYFVVLDAYGRSDTLKEVTGFDNSAFLARLEQKGFCVARRSTANYCQTALSLSATLNLRYLDDLAGSQSDDRLPLKRLIASSAVFRGFQGLGYRLVAFASGFDATESVLADLTIAPGANLGTFASMIVDQTPLWLLLGCREERQPHRRHRDRILKVFDELPTANHPSNSPTFTFAHVLSPHPPFIFGPDGQDVSAREGPYTLNDQKGEGRSGSAEYSRRYRDQVEFITRRVEDAVDRILASSEVEPIIIIQGDHGPGSRFDAESDQPNDLSERMTMLNAIYLPKAHRGAIPATISPVNTFRLVFDRCFGGRLGLLDDRSYYSPFPRPYAFQDVTGQVDRPPN